MSILKKPIITEKMNGLGEKLQHYGFVVDQRATKPQIKVAVEKMYNVQVKDISTMIYNGKTKTRFTKQGISVGKTPSYKKAIVTLKDGQTIDFFENI